VTQDDVQRAPYPGLRAFRREETDLFFGREEQTLELLQRLSTNRFVAVVGTSGSGKSSLVRCGLLSELLGGRMLVAGASWEIAVTHPGNASGYPTDYIRQAEVLEVFVDTSHATVALVLVGQGVRKLPRRERQLAVRRVLRRRGRLGVFRALGAFRGSGHYGPFGGNVFRLMFCDYPTTHNHDCVMLGNSSTSNA
jgi:hypothetical protein